MYYDSQNLIKEKMKEQQKARFDYQQKMVEIKNKYGVDFNINYLDSNYIKEIVFNISNYKNKINDIQINYDNDMNLISMNYQYSDNRIAKNFNPKKVIKEIEKENNLQTIFLEIIGCMNEYIEKKQKISTKRDVNLNTQEKMLQINKNNEN